MVGEERGGGILFLFYIYFFYKYVLLSNYNMLGGVGVFVFKEFIFSGDEKY